MTDEEHLASLLRAALGRTTGRGPSRDLWPLIVERSRQPVGWSWLDVGLGAIVAILLLMRPRWLWLLMYHL